MRCIQLSSVAWLPLSYFSTLSQKQHDFREKKLWNVNCVLIFSTTFVWNTLVRYYQICTRLRVKYPLFLSDFNKTWIFSKHLLKKYSNIKIHENLSSGGWVVPCGWTDRHRNTDMMELTVAFHDFTKAPKKVWCIITDNKTLHKISSFGLYVHITKWESACDIYNNKLHLQLSQGILLT